MHARTAARASRSSPRVAQVAAAVEQAGVAQWALTHAGVIRAFAAYALRVPLDTLLARPVPTGGVVWLRMIDAARAWEIVHWDA
jgi:alpha-ribazole phosphatase